MCYETCTECPIQQILMLPVEHAGVSSAALVAGGSGLLFAAFMTPVAKVKHCRECRYDLSATADASLICPECGATGSAVPAPLAGLALRRRARLVTGGLVLLVAGAGFAAVALKDRLA